jgi:hypothetical protein
MISHLSHDRYVVLTKHRKHCCKHWKHCHKHHKHCHKHHKHCHHKHHKHCRLRHHHGDYDVVCTCKHHHYGHGRDHWREHDEDGDEDEDGDKDKDEWKGWKHPKHDDDDHAQIFIIPELGPGNQSNTTVPLPDTVPESQNHPQSEKPPVGQSDGAESKSMSPSGVPAKVSSESDHSEASSSEKPQPSSDPTGGSNLQPPVADASAKGNDSLVSDKPPSGQGSKLEGADGSTNPPNGPPPPSSVDDATGSPNNPSPNGNDPLVSDGSDTTSSKPEVANPNGGSTNLSNEALPPSSAPPSAPAASR